MNSTGLASAHALSCSPSRARRELRGLLRSVRWPGDVESVVLAVHEAVMNAAQHGVECVSAVATVDSSRSVLVEVRDRGAGFDVERYTGTPPSASSERGRGVWLISQIAAQYELEPVGDGMCFRLRFHP